MSVTATFKTASATRTSHSAGRFLFASPTPDGLPAGETRGAGHTEIREGSPVDSHGVGVFILLPSLSRTVRLRRGGALSHPALDVGTAPSGRRLPAIGDFLSPSSSAQPATRSSPRQAGSFDTPSSRSRCPLSGARRTSNSSDTHSRPAATRSSSPSVSPSPRGRGMTRIGLPHAGYPASVRPAVGPVVSRTADTRQSG